MYIIYIHIIYYTHIRDHPSFGDKSYCVSPDFEPPPHFLTSKFHREKQKLNEAVWITRIVATIFLELVWFAMNSSRSTTRYLLDMAMQKTSRYQVHKQNCFGYTFMKPSKIQSQQNQLAKDMYCVNISKEGLQKNWATI